MHTTFHAELFKKKKKQDLSFKKKDTDLDISVLLHSDQDLLSHNDGDWPYTVYRQHGKLHLFAIELGKPGICNVAMLQIELISRSKELQIVS